MPVTRPNAIPAVTRPCEQHCRSVPVRAGKSPSHCRLRPCRSGHPLRVPRLVHGVPVGWSDPHRTRKADREGQPATRAERGSQRMALLNDRPRDTGPHDRTLTAISCQHLLPLLRVSNASRAAGTSSGSGRTLRRETSGTSPARSRSRSVSAVTATTCHGCRRPGRTTVAPGAGR